MSRLERSPLAQLTLARFLEFVREKEMVFWTFVFPILMAVGLGIAFRDRGPQKVFIGVEQGPGASSLVNELGGTEGVEARLLAPAAAPEALRKGDVALLVIPEQGGLVYRYDPTRPESRVARLAANDALERAAGSVDLPVLREEKVTEKGSRYIDFLIPGLLGLNLLGTGMWGVGFALVRMRTGKLLKRLLATPMRKTDFLLSFMTARLGFLVLEITALLTFAWLIFGVTVRGSIPALFLVAALGAFAFSGMGLLVASRAKTQEGVMGLMNVVQMPMWILSGVFFSVDHFPNAMQPFIRVLPLTALNDALRGIMNNGASLAAMSLPIAIVLVWGGACFATALAVFRWR